MTQLDSRVGTIDFIGEKTVRVGGKAAKGEDRVYIVAGLAGYLAKLGMADGELDQMIAMLQSGRREDPTGDVSRERPMDGHILEGRPIRVIGVFLAEEISRSSEKPTNRYSPASPIWRCWGPQVIRRQTSWRAWFRP